MPHSYLLEILRIYKINPSIISFLQKAMSKWTTTLHSSGDGAELISREISIRRGIYQGDSLSSLWFCLGLNPLSRLLNESTRGFKLRSEGLNHPISHLLYMDDLKLYAGSPSELKHQLAITKTFSDDIHMEFGINKCKSIHLTRGVLTRHDGFPIDNDEVIDDLSREDSYKYLGFLQLRGIMHSQIKSTLKEKFLDRVHRILATHLNAGNKTKAINTFAMPVLTYSFGVIK